MPRMPVILDFSEFDVDRVVADIEEIRRYNPQRFEMEQLTAVCYENEQTKTCVAVKDVRDDEFWVRGHMPGMPLMPGVLMCEAAAQLASYCTMKWKLIDVEMVGYGGLEGVRFRGIVRPGDRLVLVAHLLKARRAMLTCEFQGFVNRELVFEGVLKGIPLPVSELRAQANA